MSQPLLFDRASLVLDLQRRPDGWWIIGLPDEEYSAAGPYSKRAEAEEDRRGILRFYRHENEREYFTTSPIRSPKP